MFQKYRCEQINEFRPLSMYFYRNVGELEAPHLEVVGLKSPVFPKIAEQAVALLQHLVVRHEPFEVLSVVLRDDAVHKTPSHFAALADQILVVG